MSSDSIPSRDEVMARLCSKQRMDLEQCVCDWIKNGCTPRHVVITTSESCCMATEEVAGELRRKGYHATSPTANVLEIDIDRTVSPDDLNSTVWIEVDKDRKALKVSTTCSGHGGGPTWGSSHTYPTSMVFRDKKSGTLSFRKKAHTFDIPLAAELLRQGHFRQKVFMIGDAHSDVRQYAILHGSIFEDGHIIHLREVVIHAYCPSEKLDECTKLYKF